MSTMEKLVESKRNASIARAARLPRALLDRRIESITIVYAARPSDTMRRATLSPNNPCSVAAEPSRKSMTP